MNPLDKENEKEKFIFGCILLFANKIQTIGDRFDKDITMKQWFLIICILETKEHSPTLTAVADFMGCSRQNVKKMALKLEAKGLIKIENDQKDNRSVNLEVTEKCNDFFKKRENAENSFIDNLFKNLTKSDINNLYTTFSKLSRTIEEMDEQSKIGFNYGRLGNLLNTND